MSQPVRRGPRVAAVFIFPTVLIVGLLRSAQAGTVTVAWDSNRESDLAGYLVMYGERSGELDTRVDAGNHTSYQVTDLQAGRTYFFAIRAYNSAGGVSAASEEVSWTAGIAPLTLTNIMSYVRPPQPAGTSVIFATAASGGTAPYQYKWFVFDGVRSTTVKDWSDDNTLTWPPPAPKSKYTVKVRARSATNTSDAPETPEAELSIAFAR